MSIVGKGDIASILNDRKGAIFFASGVSNSQCENSDQYLREVKLLLTQRKDQCLFYFSTISIYTSNTKYTHHKRLMEQVIIGNFSNYNIIRIGNISWGSNPHTFLNAMRAKIAQAESLEIRDEYKYMISKKQLLLLTDNLPLTGRNEINVFGEMKKVKDLL